jgi:2TM domain
MLTVEQYKEAEFELALTEAKRGFQIHATVFALVMTGLIVLNVLLIALTDADFPWVVFPLVGWGIGLTGHYFCAYRPAGKLIRKRQETIERRAMRPRVAA